jgi:hypothetical protein
MLALNMNGSGDPNTSTESMRSPVSGPGQWYVPPDPNHGAFIPVSQGLGLGSEEQVKVQGSTLQFFFFRFLLPLFPHLHFTSASTLFHQF